MPTVNSAEDTATVRATQPTETESRETLDQAAEVFRQLYELAHTDPEAMRTAPHNAQIGRPDEVQAARNPILRWQA